MSSDQSTGDIVHEYDRNRSEYGSFAASFDFSSQLSFPYTPSPAEFSTYLPTDGNIYGSPTMHHRSTPNLFRGIGSLPVRRGASVEHIKLPSLLTDAMPIPLFSLRSSLRDAAPASSQRSHPYAHANREIIIDPGPIPIDVKKPGVLSLSLKRLKAKAPGWHTLTCGARDLHTVLSFSKPGGMWPSADDNHIRAKDALVEMYHYYGSSCQRLSLPALERREFINAIFTVLRLTYI